MGFFMTLICIIGYLINQDVNVLIAASLFCIAGSIDLVSSRLKDLKEGRTKNG